MYSKVKLPLLELAKWTLVAVLVLFVWMQAGGNPESNTSFDSMKQQVTASADLTSMQEADNIMVKRLYGLDPAQYDGIMLYMPTTNMGAEELLLVRLKNVEQQEIVKNAINQRLTTQKDSFEGYGVAQFEMLEKAVISVQGNYILFVVASEPKTVEQTFLNAL